MIQELFSICTGNVIWVDSNASSVSPKGTFTRPLLTLQEGVDACTASNGDLVLIKPGHSETVTVAIDFDTIGVTVRGLGKGNLRPTLNANNGAINLISVSAANCTIENIIFGAPGTAGDAQAADVSVSAAGFTMRNTYHIGSATGVNKASFVVLAATADDCLIDGMVGYNSVVDMVSGIALGAASRVEIRNSRISCNASFGYTTATFDDTAACTSLLLHDCQFKNMITNKAVVDFTSNSVGVMYRVGMSGRNTTIASNLVAGTSMDFFQTYATEQASLNGMILPAVDAE